MSEQEAVRMDSQRETRMLYRSSYLHQLRLCVVERQRDRLGLSLLFLAVLLDIHETTLMNIECGIALPTDNAALRMNMLGISVQLTEPSPISPLTRVEMLVYEKIKSMPAHMRALLNGNISNYIGVKRIQGMSLDRTDIMRYVLQSEE
jgi:hypothetical protein